MAIDMRHSKLNREEAALLSGELNKPSWESRNEGIHERVSFEDSIWGFDLAGGSFYKTPLRVTSVKRGSRAEKAGIRPGDRLKRINDIETSTLTIQEAHTIIIDSGVHLKIAVTAPEDEEDAYYCYEDPLDDGYDSEEERRKEKERERKREVHAKVSSYWSLQWPWVSKRRVIYRESNCFMVPSKFEEKHCDRFTKQPMIRTQDDIVLQSNKSEKDLEEFKNENKGNDTENPVMNGNNQPIANTKDVTEKKDVDPLVVKNEQPRKDNDDKTDNVMINGYNEIENNDIANKGNETMEVNGYTDVVSELEEESTQEDVTESITEEISLDASQEEEIINEVLEETSLDESVSKVDEDKVLNSILSDSDEQILGSSNDNDER